MSVLDVLDATRLCSRWSPATDDAWALPVPARVQPAPTPPIDFSWRGLAGNPGALLLTGIIGAGIARDSALRLLESGRRALAT